MYLFQKYKTRDDQFWWDKNRYQFHFEKDGDLDNWHINLGYRG